MFAKPRFAGTAVTLSPCPQRVIRSPIRPTMTIFGDPMTHYEYKAIPAPTRGTKAKGVKTTADRFALTLTDALNEQSADGWEFVRAETLPCEERSGLTSKTTSFQHLLIFRREVEEIDLSEETVATEAATEDDVETVAETDEVPDEMSEDLDR